MKLYYFETPNPRKPCAVAKYLDAPVEWVRIDLTKGEQKSPEFLAINPNGKVPALQDGGTALWESHAIMVYIAQLAGSNLWPRANVIQVEILKWFMWDIAHFSRHASTLYSQNYIKPAFGMGEPDADLIEEASGFFKQFASVLEQHLDGCEYLVADSLSVADFAVASMLPTAAEAQLPLDDFPQIKRWHDRLLTLPAWKDPFPVKAAQAA